MKKGRKKFSWILIIVFFFLLSALIKFYSGLRKSPYLSFSRLNFILIDETKVPLVFSFEGKGGEILTFPKENRVLVTRSFGEYELGKVFALGELEKRGGPLLRETIQENYNIAIFGYFYDEKIQSSGLIDKPALFIRKIFGRALVGKNICSLNKYDLLVLYLRSLSLKNLQFRVNKFGTANSSFSDGKITEESFSIEILNATSHNGLAQRTATLLEKSGGRVVRSADAQKEQENCEILAKQEASQGYTIKWLSSFFPCPVKVGSDGARADITLILGEDNWKNVNEKW